MHKTNTKDIILMVHRPEKLINFFLITTSLMDAMPKIHYTSELSSVSIPTDSPDAVMASMYNQQNIFSNKLKAIINFVSYQKLE